MLEKLIQWNICGRNPEGLGDNYTHPEETVGLRGEAEEWGLPRPPVGSVWNRSGL